MSISIRSYPSVTIELPSGVEDGKVSYWNALHQPIIYQMMRRDIEVSTCVDSSGNVRVNTASDISELQVGQTVYLNSGVYDGNYEVLSKGAGYFVTDAVFVSVAVVGYANMLDARQNYYAITTVYGVNNSDTYYEVGESINRPKADGTFKVDVSSFLKSLVEYRDRFAYDVINRRDNTQGGRFNISYQEFWTGSSTSPSAISDTPIYFVNAAKQLQQVYGSNMGEYVPFNDTDGWDAKFMGCFNKPTYFPGFPFSLSFIFSENIFGLELFKFERQKDVNDGTVSTLDYELDNGQALGVNRLMLSGNFPTTTKTVDVWLETGIEECIQYVHNDYEQDEYVEEICEVPPIGEPVGEPSP